MKQIFSKLILLLVAVTMVACSNNDAEYRPGVWTSQDVIETFPGDTVLVQGQVSNYIGLDKLELSCDAWGIRQVYQLEGEHSKVFIYNYQMPVPADATFNQELKVTVTDTEGTENKKTIVLKYLPDTSAPTLGKAIDSEISVEFDTANGSGTYLLSNIVADDRALKDAILEVEGQPTQIFEFKGRTADLNAQVTFDKVGRYPMTLTISDEGGNETVINSILAVMPAEVENPYSDYPIMWVVNASEKASDYLDGYYAPMTRTDAYQYSGKIYADKDNYQIFFTAEKTMTGDLFGSSPLVSSKLMNNNGYVVPVIIPKKGYYGVWIDINAHIYSIWDLDTSEAYTGPIMFAGSGFADWGLDAWGNMTDEMTRDGYRYTCTVKQNGNQTTHNYYGADVSDWSYVLRYWSTAEGCGWWEDKDGSGGSVGAYESDYEGNVEVTFDTLLLWATVKKK
jgi:hypothetical protein